MRRETFWYVLAAMLVAGLVLSDAAIVHASAGGGGGLPYESALVKLQQSATGPLRSSCRSSGSSWRAEH